MSKEKCCFGDALMSNDTTWVAPLSGCVGGSASSAISYANRRPPMPQ